MNTTALKGFGYVLGAIVVLSLLSGCGTTSGIKRPGGADPAALTQYDRIIVKDFADRVTPRTQPQYQDQTRQAMQDVTRTFSDMIADQVRRTGVFQEVAREGAASPGTIAVTGDITQFERGRGTLRTFIGHGAGRSEFDAVVELRDAESNKLLGTVIVDKNSWPLPGAVAGTQTADSFMEAAAKKIANELQRAKTGLPTGR